ncbi:uncharacterized protein MYCGRDRAFT_70665 [Zymoseptoria tritici IPO323]|uniref:Phytase A n=1 Tax=Zymoseptoria tritici (strain CBS 115943 / IPO323) TaxID=336722 RepID=F9X862_ZYMTI|nr:uncharacterized protein MYCGRDRAFT_70665 [Zymoseptoria tritici IPO323]EGP87805.1 hypothetical protein MYCGRDRAFT_70665 [Zymoseptoria tritici IPO323]
MHFRDLIMTPGKKDGDRRRYKYERLGRERESSLLRTSSRLEKLKRVGLLGIMVLALGFVAVLLVSGSSASPPTYGGRSCDSVQNGYQCQPRISHFWGQYSPWFSVESSIPNQVPPKCEISFAQVLSRHGARDPTASKSKAYNATVQKVHATAKSYPGNYAFLKDYEYTLGADQLTLFGEQQMINSGTNYYQRYQHLASKCTPFIRSASEARVVESAQNWTQGFHAAKTADRSSKPNGDSTYPYPMVVISEASGSNNTLNHDLCTAFEDGPDSTIAANAQKTWSNIFVPPIQKRLNNDLGGANLILTDVVYMMDLCPFSTVASPGGQISPFCDLFTESEWHQYNYYESLNKHYGYSHGNPLGPTQGVGFVNELIARMTSKPVQDHTSTNHTLDDNMATFPLGRELYADFSHDNDMTAIYSALGLYNTSTTAPLPNTTVVEAGGAGGYSAAWTVPFGARVYFEKMQCKGEKEELVRVIVNDRVVPLAMCEADRLGRCKLGKFVEGLAFARNGGKWDQCFK